jgi:ribosomal protein S18 acetylase RimI-like enzyme
MTVRVLTPDDAAEFAALRLLGLERHPEAFATSADDWRQAPLSRAVAQLAPAEAAAGRFVVGAFDRGQDGSESGPLVGLLGIRREARASVRHKASVWGFFVHCNARRRGLGGALLDAALAEARRLAGLAYLRIVLTVPNEAAGRLLASRGFVRYGLESGGLRTDSRAYDQAFLRCDLRAGSGEAEPRSPGGP